MSRSLQRYVVVNNSRQRAHHFEVLMLALTKTPEYDRRVNGWAFSIDNYDKLRNIMYGKLSKNPSNTSNNDLYVSMEANNGIFILFTAILWGESPFLYLSAL